MPSLNSSQVLLFGAALAVALVVALFPYFPRQFPVHESDIASNSIRSPRADTFESEVLTEQARSQAAQAVPDVLTYDQNTRTKQLTSLATAIGAIATVRSNSDQPEAEKRARLLAVQELASLSRTSIDTILDLSDDRWAQVASESQRVLENVLSRSIAPDSVDQERNNLANEVSPNLTADEANAVADLARPLVVPTLVVDQTATDDAREAATKDVQPVLQTVAKGQLIVEAGQPIDAATLELLREVDLLRPRLEWDSLAAVIIIAGLAAAVLMLYVWLFPVAGITTRRNLLLLALLIAVPVLVARLYFSLVLPDDSRRFLAYFLPLATFSMLVATLLEARLALVIGLIQAMLMTFIIIYLPDFSLVSAIEPVDVGRVLLVYGLGATVGVIAVYRAERPNQYVMAGVLVSVVVLAVLFATWLVEPDRRGFDAVWMVSAAAVNGIGSGLLTAGGVAAVGAILGVTTRLQLMELSQLNAPLLRRLQDEAPGTFHHSIIVANLAERAADRIGGDALLVRVGCYYHDIGKVLQPGFYIENQLGGGNPHDRMDPKDSARVIAQHVEGGLELAKRHGLPPKVQAFIPQHHGTRLIPYFFRKASQQDEPVDDTFFRYPGPRPQSRETAIVMLADSTEAMVRASEDRSLERIDAIVDEVVAERLAEGELEECDLTLRDMRIIADSFKRTLRGVYHPRIAYPEPTAGERRALIGRFRPGRRAPRSASPATPTPAPPVAAPSRRRKPT